MIIQIIFSDCMVNVKASDDNQTTVPFFIADGDSETFDEKRWFEIYQYGLKKFEEKKLFKSKKQ